jgi:predicted MPP superfamily phosphohydrolase
MQFTKLAATLRTLSPRERIRWQTWVHSDFFNKNQRLRQLCSLVLAHAPNILDQLSPEQHTDLTLCGHSHAGQWRIPGIPTFWLPPGCHGRTHGMYEKGGHRLYVNRGLGWSVLPMRWNCPPEIVLLEWAA